MSSSHASVDAAIAELDRLLTHIKRIGNRQVRAVSDTAFIKATCLAWFNNHRAFVLSAVEDAAIKEVDEMFQEVLSGTDHATTKDRYVQWIKELRERLSRLRSLTLVPIARVAKATTDTPPRFSSLVADAAMQRILEDRWIECAKCIQADAPMAATVMMGGLLESLLLARVLKEPNRSAVFNQPSSPKDPKTSKALPLQDWTLRHYIDVARDLKWISESAKDVGEVLRDYRNYIHPNKQLSHGRRLESNDAKLWWEISKAISRELV